MKSFAIAALAGVATAKLGCDPLRKNACEDPYSPQISLYQNYINCMVAVGCMGKIDPTYTPYYYLDDQPVDQTEAQIVTLMNLLGGCDKDRKATCEDPTSRNYKLYGGYDSCMVAVGCSG